MAIKLLKILDSAKIQFYHFKAIIVAGMGLFTDAYDFFSITPVMNMIGRIYYTKEGEHGVTPPGILSVTVGVALLGAATGQVVFGYLGDRMGRRKVYGISLLMMILSSVGCGFSICRTRTCVISSLCLFRFLLGVGIGGDYPLSATIMSEFANRKTRGAFIAAVFSMQGFGILTSSAVTMAVTKAFKRFDKGSRSGFPQEADLAWRIILMIGAIPATLTFYWRMMMPETPRYTALVERNVGKATADMREVLDEEELQAVDDDSDEENPMETATPQTSLAPYGLFSRSFLRDHGVDLFSCSASWFLLDVVFYSGNLFQSHVYDDFFNIDEQHDVYRKAFLIAKIQAIIATASTIPGYWVAVYLIDRVGRVRLQFVGFFFMGAFLFAIGGPYEHHWKNNIDVWFLVLYAVTFFFANLGPNTTTFIVPAELFPARFRSTCHGIAGAWGKVGAVFGAVGFLWASKSSKEEEVKDGYRPGIGMMPSLLILGGVCLLGMVVTACFMRETKGRSLEENEAEAEAVAAAEEEETGGAPTREWTTDGGVFDNNPPPSRSAAHQSLSTVAPFRRGEDGRG